MTLTLTCLYIRLEEPPYRSPPGRWRGRSSSPGRVKNYHFSISSRPAPWPTHLTIQWVSGAFSLGGKWPGRETDHSPRTSAEVKKTWIYTFTTLYVFFKSKSHYDRQSVGQSVLVSGAHLGPATNFPSSLSFLLDSCGLVFSIVLSDERTDL
jgi:hypothetical protein